MVASQSVVQQEQLPPAQNDMYCSAMSQHYHGPGEYYEGTYYVHGPPPDLAGAGLRLHDYCPVTVPMVSTNSSPPVAMPVQVPPGHMVQQIVDENGTLRHVIISTQHPPGVLLPPHNAPHYGTAPPNGTNQGPQPLMYPHHHGVHFPPPHFHSNIPPGHLPHGPANAPNAGHSPPPSHAYYKDERTHRQHNKLRKKLHDKQQKGGIVTGGGNGDAGGPNSLSPMKDLVNGLTRSHKEKGMNSVGTSEDGEESSSVQDEEDSIHIITDILSSVQAPKVSELTSRSALLQWAPPLRLSEASSNDSHEQELNEEDLRYEVLLSSDKSKEQMKYKSIYSGDSLSCRIQDLKPGQEYSVCLQVHLEELQGSATEPIKFTTPPCEPDQPQPPKLVSRSKNSLQLRWNHVNENGSQIIHYILEYDEGKNGEFIEIHKSKGKHHNHHLQKLQPSTSYKFRLAVLNEIGKSLYSDVVAYTTAENAPSQPAPPTLKDSTESTLHLQWQKRPEDHNFVLQINEQKYGFLTVYNGTDSEYVCNNKLRRFSDYVFRLRSKNEGGDSPWSSEVTFRTLPDRPSKPIKPAVKGRIHAHCFRLKWEPVSDTGGAEVTEYILELNSGSGYRRVYTGIETEAICDNLAPGTTYQLRVCCKSIGGHSDYSDPCTVTTEAITPSICQGLKLVGKPRATSLGLRWNEPDYYGGAPILEYEVFTINSDSSPNLVCKTKECEIVVTDLRPGTEYTFSVRAVNRVGPGPFSEYTNICSGAAPPNWPENVVVISESPKHVIVSWSEPRDNGATIKEYKLEMSPGLSKSPMQSCSSESKESLTGRDLRNIPNDDQFQMVYQGPALSSDIKNLTPSTIYFFRVQACNSAGCSPFCPIVEAKTPPAPPSLISTPKSMVTPTSIHLCWQEPECYGCPVIYYNIELGEQSYRTEGSESEFTIEDLTPNTVYKVKLQAISSVGIGPFTTVKLMTARLPPSPPKLECIGTSYNYLKLKWGDGKNQDYTTYYLEMANNRTNEFQRIFKGTSLTFKVTKLQEITIYRFRISAKNDAGKGEFSDVYEFKTIIAPPAAVRTPKVIEVEQRQCVLEWNVSKNNTNDKIIYIVQLTKLREQDYKEVYRGSEITCTLDHLDPGTDYSVRVLPVRMTSTGELLGPHSSDATFKTVAIEPLVSSRSQSSTGGSPLHTRHKAHTTWPYVNFKTITKQQKVFLMAVLVTIFSILVSMVIGKMAI
ncbi:fibronectin type-III domain-containing protein 3A isoform X3 [Onthophagus taurus]|uniref:fibronectin type-III domain-containing protein 3A isoform X3 n=1 Tax=Onthophagus taurus TaxID=166361 RepID=UPI000C204A7C|nr:fibronectin type-III domain-containing protein 3A isoform X3 [Onthophagus taurus]XP_022918887.1 fibronectin type-III domain-containing protein 3A isoform X3 [Onthophagus taurus]